MQLINNIKLESMPSFHVKWKSPSNIALIKYWGKHGHQLPANPSLSMTLSESVSTTEVIFTPLPDASGPTLQFTFEGNPNLVFQQRIEKYLQKLAENEMPFLKRYHLDIRSQNSFPHSSGIASSAAFMSSLALCLCSVEEQLLEDIGYAFYERSSYIARLGSGSAARSVYGGYVNWGHSMLIPHSSDEYATPVNKFVHESFMHYADAIIVISDQPKKLSSSQGHQLMSNHPFQLARYRQAAIHHEDLLRYLLCDDKPGFADVVEAEALQLHALIMTSKPWHILIEPETLRIIQLIKQFRTDTGIPVCFTLDAGPNIHVLYPLEYADTISQFITDSILTALSHPVRIIYDQLGKGPERLLFQHNP